MGSARGSTRPVLAGHTIGYSPCLAYAPDGSQLASGSNDETVRLWDPRGEKPSPRLKRAYLCSHVSRPMRRMVSRLASGSEDKTVRLWDPRGEKPSQCLAGHGHIVKCLTYAPDGEQLVSSGKVDKTVRLWDTRTGACLKIWHAPAAVTELLWRADTVIHGL